MAIKLHLVNHYDKLLKPGDAMKSFNTKKDRLQLVIVCPGCGKISAPAEEANHVFNRKTLTYTPSIVHKVELGGCGWHGWLTNGEFTDA